MYIPTPTTDIWQAFYKIWNPQNTAAAQEQKKGVSIFTKQLFVRNDGYFDVKQPSAAVINVYTRVNKFKLNTIYIYTLLRDFVIKFKNAILLYSVA